MDGRIKDAKILIVDDVEVNLIILEEIIKNMGYQAYTASSVKDALALINEEKTLPHLILTDIAMPEIDGFEFCAILKKNPYTRDIPVVFISAMDSAGDLIQGFELGAVDFIPKPFERVEVEMRVNTHLKLYELQRSLEETNKRLNLVVARQAERLRKEQKNIMTSLASLVESKESIVKSENMSTHYENICYNSRIMAQALAMSPKFEGSVTDIFVDGIESSAGLHDIGKIMIPDDILLKKGRLTREEREVMRTHTQIGAEILTDIYRGKEKSDFLEMAIDIANYHHENWDGSGYPKKLKGEEIPLSARIVKLVDVFDALIGLRVYKEPMPVESALVVMKEGRGTLFDPDMIDVFLKIYRNFKGVKKE